MPRPVARVVVALFALVAFATSAGVAVADEIVVEGKRVVVHSTVATRAAAERCRDALEAAIPVYEQNLPFRMPEGEKVVLYLWATAEEYEKAVTDGGASAFAKFFAATLAKTKESHVVLQPRADPEFLALVDGLPEMTRFLVCHEGVHQFCRRAGAHGYDFWPAWYCEGMADFLAERCLAADAEKGAAKGAPVPIHVDDQRHGVADALARGVPIGLERLLYAEPVSFANKFLVYSHWHELYRLLAADDARLRRFHDAVRRLPLPGGPGAGQRDDRRVEFAKPCADALASVYGPLDALEASFRRQTAATKPEWFQENRASQRVGDEVVCSGFPGRNAILVSAGAPPAAPYALSCEVNLLGVSGRQADLYLAYRGREDPQFLKLAFGAAGFVTCLAYSDGSWQDRYKRNADVPPDTLPPGAWIPVRVVVDRATVRVEVRGKPVLEAPVPPGFDALGGSWGLGATDDVARFRKIVVTPAAR